MRAEPRSRRSLVLYLAAPAVLLAACLPAGRGAQPPEGGASASTRLLDGSPALDGQAAAAQLAAASSALGRGALEEAAAGARRVVEAHPATPAAGDAWWLLARALAGLGRSAEAEAAAAAHLRSLPPGDPRAVDVRLFQAERLREAGRPDRALAVLLALPPELPAGANRLAVSHVRELAPALPGEALGRALRDTPLGQPLSAPVMVAYARALLLAGDPAGAERYARAALELGLEAPESETAGALLDGVRGPSVGASVRVAAVLPLGAQALQQLAREVEEGVRAALEAGGSEASVALSVVDDRGNPEAAAVLVQSLEAEGVVAVIGPLTDAALHAAAAARGGALPLLSPTAAPPPGARSVWSLGGADPEAARALARHAAERGIRQVVVLHSTERGSDAEASAFREAFEALGGSVLRALPYRPGQSSFAEALDLVRNLRPQAVVAAVPESDVAVVAPVLATGGLSSLGIRTFGTAGWASPAVLASVAATYTNGVVAVSPETPWAEPPGRRGMSEAFAALGRAVPPGPGVALGWDAASLVLLALRAGATTAADVAGALEGVRAFPGATGTLHFEGGGVRREHHVVCIQERSLLRCAG